EATERNLMGSFHEIEVVVKAEGRRIGKGVLAEVTRAERESTVGGIHREVVGLIRKVIRIGAADVSAASDSHVLGAEHIRTVLDGADAVHVYASGVDHGAAEKVRIAQREAVVLIVGAHAACR